MDIRTTAPESESNVGINSQVPVSDCEHGAVASPNVDTVNGSPCAWSTPPIAVSEPWISRWHRPETILGSQAPEFTAVAATPSDASLPVDAVRHAGDRLLQASSCLQCRVYREYGQKKRDSELPAGSMAYGTIGTAQLGCPLCAIFLSGTEAVGGSLHPLKGKEEGRYVFGNCKWNADYFYLMARRHEWRTKLEVNFYCTPDLPCPWGLFPSRQDILPLNHPRSFDLMSDWLRDCEANHPTCGRQAEGFGPPVLPTRILDLGDSHDDLRLVEPAGAKERYACLSHCWGTSKPLQTTVSSLQEHLRNIPWMKMPRTFRDAISVTRYLGLHYLWIDSLCIIQDDPADWEAEAAKMANIYSNSSVTIAATSAKGARSGILSDSGNILADIFGKRGGPNGDKDYNVRVRTEIRHPVMQGQHRATRSTAGGDVTDPDHWPLLRRGWVFQERLLSTRVLHLSHPEMIWECKEKMRCECGIMNAAENQKGSFWRKVRSLQTLDYEAGPTGGDLDNRVAGDYWADDFHRLWWSIVQTYTGLDLTYHSDRLPALAGIVKSLMSVRPGNEYVAGLWSDKLLYDLLWMTSTSSSLMGREKGSPADVQFVSPQWLVNWRNPARLSPSRPKALRRVAELGPPSWSWASRAQEQIVHSFKQPKRVGSSEIISKQTGTLCRIETIHRRYIFSDSTLGDTGSSLTLHGSLNRIVFGDHIEQPPGHNPRRLSAGRRFLHESLYPEPGNPILHDKSPNGGSSVTASQAIIVHSINGENEPSTPLGTNITVTFDSHLNYLGYHAPQIPPRDVGFYCLPVAWVKGRYPSGVMFERVGLVLQVIDLERCVFRRIGLVHENFNMPVASGDKAALDELGRLESLWQHHNMFLSTNTPSQVITLI